MKKLLFGCLIFLFVLTGCSTVNSLESDMQVLLKDIEENYEEGYTLEGTLLIMDIYIIAEVEDD